MRNSPTNISDEYDAMHAIDPEECWKKGNKIFVVAIDIFFWIDANFRTFWKFAKITSTGAIRFMHIFASFMCEWVEHSSWLMVGSKNVRVNRETKRSSVNLARRFNLNTNKDSIATLVMWFCSHFFPLAFFGFFFLALFGSLSARSNYFHHFDNWHFVWVCLWREHVCLRSSINEAQNVSAKEFSVVVPFSPLHIIFLVVSCLFIESIKIW